MTIGILAYGSLIHDPGHEIGSHILRRIPTETPFPVEFARLSAKRGDAPTVVPHPSGKPVRSEVLVLSDQVSIDDAKSLLWRRETGRKGIYREKASPNAVVIRDIPGFCGLDHILYTDFNNSGKIDHPDPVFLADAAICSMKKASNGQDGISYLIACMDSGVETPLTRRYSEEILHKSHVKSLSEALVKFKNNT
jgi:hypothetical protein